MIWIHQEEWAIVAKPTVVLYDDYMAADEASRCWRLTTKITVYGCRRHHHPRRYFRSASPDLVAGSGYRNGVSVFLLVILGGVVRVTGSGLGCPDWPLCYGKVLPPWEYTAVIEYTHRFVASVIVGPLVLATAIVALARYRSDRWVWIPAAISVPMLIIQGCWAV